MVGRQEGTMMAGSTLKETPEIATLLEKIKVDLRRRAEKKACLALLKTPRKFVARSKSNPSQGQSS